MVVAPMPRGQGLGQRTNACSSCLTNESIPGWWPYRTGTSLPQAFLMPVNNPAQSGSVKLSRDVQVPKATVISSAGTVSSGSQWRVNSGLDCQIGEAVSSWSCNDFTPVPAAPQSASSSQNGGFVKPIGACACSDQNRRYQHSSWWRGRQDHPLRRCLCHCSRV